MYISIRNRWNNHRNGNDRRYSLNHTNGNWNTHYPNHGSNNRDFDYSDEISSSSYDHMYKMNSGRNKEREQAVRYIYILFKKYIYKKCIHIIQFVHNLYIIYT